jgi:outer membrane protein OmpA-like peptidoglycan-associated protein
MAALTQQYGIAASHLTPLGVGSDKLVVDTPDQTDEPRNRVVRIVNLGPAQ